MGHAQPVVRRHGDDDGQGAEQPTAARIVTSCSYALGLMFIGAAVITLALV